MFNVVPSEALQTEFQKLFTFTGSLDVIRNAVPGHAIKVSVSVCIDSTILQFCNCHFFHMVGQLWHILAHRYVLRSVVTVVYFIAEVKWNNPCNGKYVFTHIWMIVTSLQISISKLSFHKSYRTQFALKACARNRNHFRSPFEYPSADGTIIVSRLTLYVRGPRYFGLSPGHQQPWYWLYRIGSSLS